MSKTPDLNENDENLYGRNDGLRIASYLARCGVSSRRKCERIILENRVEMNGKPVRDLSIKVYPGDNVKLDGKNLVPEDKTVIALNKPEGYLSTVSDKFLRKTVMDLIPYKNSRLYPAGRLDVNSRGLIIMTNDGDLAYRITHPKFGIPKVYDVLINKKINAKDIRFILDGVKIEGSKLYPKNVEIIKTGAGNEFYDFRKYDKYKSSAEFSLVRIKIAEGRKRIIRKVFKAIGYKVIDLKRIQIGDFKLNDYKAELTEGKFKVLNKAETEKLIKGVINSD